MSSTDVHDEAGAVWCFQCGSEFDEEVDECIECGVPTSSDRPRAADEVGDEHDEQLAYEFHEWTGQGRSTLDGMLARQGIQRAWQGATLIVREADEEAVDAAVAEAEVVAMPTLDLTQPTIVYELGDLDDDQHGRLLRRLGEHGISHAFDQAGDLFVYDRDEEAVDTLFEGLDEADASEREFGPGVPGVDPAAIMSDLLVAAARLVKKPADPKGVIAMVETASIAERMTLPYGLGAELWGAVVDQASELSDVLSGEAVVEDAGVSEMAERLHAILRPVV